MSSIFRTNAFGPALPPRLQTGGIALFANGTGVASFDHLYWTQYPNPALNLSPVGRAGSSFIQWNANLPLNTTLGIDASVDGLTWTDMSGQNGATITPINGEPDPTVDLFSADSSANYFSGFGGYLGYDSFARANASGWGNASDGQAWAHPGGVGALSIASNEGVLTGSTGNDYMVLGSTTGTDCEGVIRTAISLASDLSGIVLRFTDTSHYYRCFIGNTNSLTIQKNNAGLTTLASAVQTFSINTFYWLRFRIQGTMLMARAWQDGTGEPTTWTLSTTDATFASGQFGLNGSASGANTVKVDSFSAGVIKEFGTDSFTRANQSGFGTAFDGQTWNHPSGTGTLSIASNEGVVTASTGNDLMTLGASTVADAEGLVRTALSLNTDLAGILLRYVDTTHWYRCIIGTNPNRLIVQSNVGGSLTTLASSVQSFTNNTFYWIRFRIVGTTLLARAWQDGTGEPTTWTINIIDTNFASGQFGLNASASGANTAKFDSFAAVPVADFTSPAGIAGTLGTWTYDTANSRLVATGGVQAAFANENIAQTEIEVLCDLDQADAGGLIWGQVDDSDYYLLVAGDDHASVSTPNRLSLYKVAGNVSTQINQATINFVRGTFHRLKVTNLSGVITCYFDGAQQFTYTDPAPLGAGNVGLYSNGGTVGARFYQLWIQPMGDNLNQTWPTYLYTRQRLATTDPTQTPQVLDMTIAVYGGTIDPGVVIPSVDYRNTVVSSNMDDLAKQSNYAWWIDQNKSLYFQSRPAIPAPWILYSTTRGVPVDLEVDSNLLVEVSNDLYRNRETLINVIASGAFVDPFKGDGQTNSFTLRYPIAPGTVPSITLNAVVQTVAMKGATGAQWYYAEGDPVIAQDNAGTILISTDTLSVTYTGTFLTTVQVDNTTAQTALAAVEGGSGIVEDVQDMQGAMTFAAAQTFAQQLLTRYCVEGRTITFGTVRSGLQCGQIIACFIPEEGVWNMQALIVSIDVTLQTAQVSGATTNLYYYVVQATELPNKGSWQKLLASSILLT